MLSVILGSMLAASPPVGIVEAEFVGNNVIGLFSPTGDPASTAFLVNVVLASPAPIAALRVESCLPLTTNWTVDGHTVKAKAVDASVVLIDARINGERFSLQRSDNKCFKRIELVDAAGARLPVVLPRTVAGTVTASSVLNPPAQYGPERAFDNNTSMAWSTSGDGTGQSLTVTFEAPQKLTEIRVAAGYWRSPEHLEANGFPLELEISADGKVVATLSPRLEDAKAKAPEAGAPFPARVALPNVPPATRWQFKDLKIAPGKKYADTLISEIQLFNGPERLLVDVRPFRAKVRTELEAKLAPAGWAASPLGQTFHLIEAVEKDVGGWSFCHAVSDLSLSSDGVFGASSNRYCVNDSKKYASADGDEWRLEGGYTVKKVSKGCALLEASGLLTHQECPDPMTRQPDPDAEGCPDGKSTSRLGTVTFQVCSAGKSGDLRVKVVGGPFQFLLPDSDAPADAVKLEVLGHLRADTWAL